LGNDLELVRSDDLEVWTPVPIGIDRSPEQSWSLYLTSSGPALAALAELWEESPYPSTTWPTLTKGDYMLVFPYSDRLRLEGPGLDEGVSYMLGGMELARGVEPDIANRTIGLHDPSTGRLMLTVGFDELRSLEAARPDSGMREMGLIRADERGVWAVQDMTDLVDPHSWAQIGHLDDDGRVTVIVSAASPGGPESLEVWTGG
jgi:hypothetical protein